MNGGSKSFDSSAASSSSDISKCRIRSYYSDKDHGASKRISDNSSPLNPKLLSSAWFDDLKSCTLSNFHRQKKNIKDRENDVKFWDSQRNLIRNNEIQYIEARISVLRTNSAIINDPYLEPQPIPRVLPYKRSEPKRPSDLPILDENQWLSVESQMRKCGPETVLVNKFRLSVTKLDMLSLLSTNWLTDMVINFYMNMLHHRSHLKASDGFPKVAIMNTFFYSKLSSRGFESVKRWTRKFDIFDHDLFFVPIHDRGIHWCLSVVDLREKSITYYDSMGGSNDLCLQYMMTYLKEEHMSKRSVPLPDAEAYTLRNAKDSSPQQNNGSDCGVFTCTTAEFLSRDRDLSYSQEDMPGIRQRMLYEIFYQRLLTTDTDLSQITC